MPTGAHKIESPDTDKRTFDELTDAEVQERVRQFRAKHGTRVIEPMDPEAYREAIEGVISLAGTEPELVAPPRRRVD